MAQLPVPYLYIPPLALAGGVQDVLAKLAAAHVPLAPKPQPVTITNKRYFADITGLMTIEERGTDRLTITRHPVASGVDITDHSYKEPAELVLRMMATNATSASAQFATVSEYLERTGNSSTTYVEAIYQKLIGLQAGRQTFKVQTGKRLYENMLIESMMLTTDQTSEHALMLQINCREIIVVQTSVIPYAPPEDQADPAKTNGVSDQGIKQPVPTSIVPGQAALDAIQPSGLLAFPSGAGNATGGGGGGAGGAVGAGGGGGGSGGGGGGGIVIINPPG